MGELLVVVEHRNQKLADITLEMLSKGRKLADQSGNTLSAIAIGSEIQGFTSEIAKWADRVIAINDPKMRGSLAEPYQKIISPIIKKRKPKIVLMGHSSFGMDLAPALAIEIEAPLVTDCTDIIIENGNISVRRSMYHSKVDALYSFLPSEIAVVTVRLGQFSIEELQVDGAIDIVDSPLRDEIDYKKFIEYVELVVGDVDITKSRVLVAVGRGIKDKANITLAEELSRALGGELAASRPMVDYGWLPPDRQIGLSGKTVKPEVYIALGISGAIQHLAGMKSSQKIIAINKDPSAPIFSIADYGIVDDLFNVVPKLIEKVKEIKHGATNPV